MMNYIERDRKDKELDKQKDYAWYMYKALQTTGNDKAASQALHVYHRIVEEQLALWYESEQLWKYE